MMRRRRRLDHQRLCVAHVRKVARQPKRVDQFSAYGRVLPTFDPKAQHAAERAVPEHLAR
jgi:hypothetical protein